MNEELGGRASSAFKALPWKAGIPIDGSAPIHSLDCYSKTWAIDRVGEEPRRDPLYLREIEAVLATKVRQLLCVSPNCFAKLE